MPGWKLRDPLYRGDAAAAVSIPDPDARLSLVEHILYLKGYGRDTQYTSVSEREDVAKRFAGRRGAVWQTDVARATLHGAKHHSKDRLVRDLRGQGRGTARWRSAWEVAQARANVLRWSEHLLDWSNVPAARIAVSVQDAFER